MKFLETESALNKKRIGHPCTSDIEHVRKTFLYSLGRCVGLATRELDMSV